MDVLYPKKVITMKIMAICGSGLGSSFMVEMNIKKVLKKLDIEAEVEHSDLSSATPGAADLFVMVPSWILLTVFTPWFSRTCKIILPSSAPSVSIFEPTLTGSAACSGRLIRAASASVPESQLVVITNIIDINELEAQLRAWFARQ